MPKHLASKKTSKIPGSSCVIFASGFYSIENAVSVEWCLQGTPFYKEDSHDNAKKILNLLKKDTPVPVHFPQKNSTHMVGGPTSIEYTDKKTSIES